jgi:sn-glycerol 3-phosphate transport system ATP-binding protein
MVFQNYALYPHMTVARNMGYGLKNRGLSKDEIDGKVAEAARMLKLEEYLERRPSQLSGGQRQRVAMGRAIVRQPDLFLFDEPLSNLDAKLRNQMRVEIRALQRRLGTTSIYVTHDQVEAMTMADRIIVLNGGVIEQIGTPAEIYATPASTFVAGFMGAPPMNLLEGQLNGSGHASLNGGVTMPVSASSEKPQNVFVGVRPEDVVMGSAGDIPFDIDLIEERGPNRLLHGALSGQRFTVSVNKDEAVETGQATVRVKPGSALCFAADTGRRI